MDGHPVSLAINHPLSWLPGAYTVRWLPDKELRAKTHGCAFPFRQADRSQLHGTICRRRPCLQLHKNSLSPSSWVTRKLNRNFPLRQGGSDQAIVGGLVGHAAINRAHLRAAGPHLIFPICTSTDGREQTRARSQGLSVSTKPPSQLQVLRLVPPPRHPSNVGVDPSSCRDKTRRIFLFRPCSLPWPSSRRR